MLHKYLAHDSPLLLSIFFVIFLVMQPYNFFSQYWERYCNIFEQITSQLLQSGIHYLEKYMRSNFLHLRIPLEILCFLMNYHKDQSIYLLSSLRGDKALPVHLDIEDATTDASHSCRRQEIWTLRWHKTLLHDLYALTFLLCSGTWDGVNKGNIHKNVSCQPSRFPYRNSTRHSSRFSLCQGL